MGIINTSYQKLPGTGARTVVRTAAAVAVAGMSTGPAVNASAPGGTDVVCARRSKKGAIEPGTASVV